MVDGVPEWPETPMDFLESRIGLANRYAAILLLFGYEQGEIVQLAPHEFRVFGGLDVAYEGRRAFGEVVAGELIDVKAPSAGDGISIEDGGAFGGVEIHAGAFLRRDGVDAVGSVESNLGRGQADRGFFAVWFTRRLHLAPSVPPVEGDATRRGNDGLILGVEVNLIRQRILGQVAEAFVLVVVGPQDMGYRYGLGGGRHAAAQFERGVGGKRRITGSCDAEMAGPGIALGGHAVA